ncbi:hypothetical protein DPMN_048816 [Dreissena polymorpha]|uniref:Uncharacterized protein n=1 Tax=Dreissena polymorpha TaxID=45954 RepID=A0A9D4DBD7_DREPO|nr:hypothetical protein DPMN_048816 [Dreissena polymorpha]
MDSNADGYDGRRSGDNLEASEATTRYYFPPGGPTLVQREENRDGDYDDLSS